MKVNQDHHDLAGKRGLGRPRFHGDGELPVC